MSVNGRFREHHQPSEKACQISRPLTFQSCAETKRYSKCHDRSFPLQTFSKQRRLAELLL